MQSDIGLIVQSDIRAVKMQIASPQRTGIETLQRLFERVQLAPALKSTSQMHSTQRLTTNTHPQPITIFQWRTLNYTSRVVMDNPERQYDIAYRIPIIILYAYKTQS